MDINKENIQAILVCRDASNIQIKEHFLLFNQIYFEFDNIFVNESTKLIYENNIKPRIYSTISGFNNSILTYGQTNTGKSYSLGLHTDTIYNDHIAGILPRTLTEFCQILNNSQEKHIKLYFSFVELENEKIKDLLNEETGLESSKKIKIEEVFDNFLLTNVIEKEISDMESALTTVKCAFKRFSKMQTNKILTFKVESSTNGKIRTSKLHLFDLACTSLETYQKQGNKTFLKNFQAIYSLQTLVKSLDEFISDKKKFINYNMSLLTRLLKNSFGGNSKTLLISFISPENNKETLNTLEFVKKVRKIENNVVPSSFLSNELVSDHSKVRKT
jgi:hypothetical protein